MRERRQAHGRLVAIEIDPGSLAHAAEFIDAERRAAIRDLIAENRFSPRGQGGAYNLRLSIADKKLVLDVADENGDAVARHILSLTPLARVVKDYFLVCESYYAAMRTSSPARIEAIDMGRRSIHNEGAEALIDRLAGKIDMDFDTGRRLFTLVCALRWRR
ncbi:MAG TPA: UPF0262 family protein [Bauldia sp.]|nr:UPF0262 family protein [Bauldia sp.]